MSVPEPRWKRLDPGARRSQILDAARRAFAGAGYEAVSMRDVAREAGVTPGLLHHYFGGKRELFLAVLRSVAEEAPLTLRLDLDLPPEQAIAANVDAWLDLVEQNRETALAVGGVGPFGRDPEVEAVVDELRERVIDRILLALFGSTEVPAPTRLALRGYAGLFDAAVNDWLVHGRASRDDVHALVSRALLVMVRDVVPSLLGEADRS